MRYLLPIALFIISGCHNKKDYEPSFRVIDFTFDNGWDTSYSVLISNTDFFIIGKGRNQKKYYKGILEESRVKRIDSFLVLLSHQKIDSVYIDKKEDQPSFMLIFRGKGAEHKYYVYGANSPLHL